MARCAAQRKTDSDVDTPMAFGVKGVRVVSTEEGHAMLDRQTRRVLGMSADELLAKWDAGEIDTTNPETHIAIMNLAGFIPFAR